MTAGSASDQDQQTALIAAIQGFATKREKHYASKAIYRLQRISSGNAHPYGWPIGSVWNAYSWDVQNGPSEYTETIIDIVESVVEDVIGQIPAEEVTLLASALSGGQTESGSDAASSVSESITDAISTTASQRDMDRFDPEYRWYENL